MKPDWTDIVAGIALILMCIALLLTVAGVFLSTLYTVTQSGWFQ